MFYPDVKIPQTIYRSHKLHNMSREIVKTINIYGSVEKAAIEALRQNLIKGYSVEIECVVQNKHYRLYLYR